MLGLPVSATASSTWDFLFPGVPPQQFKHSSKGQQSSQLQNTAPVQLPCSSETPCDVTKGSQPGVLANRGLGLGTGTPVWAAQGEGVKASDDHQQTRVGSPHPLDLP